MVHSHEVPGPRGPITDSLLWMMMRLPSSLRDIALRVPASEYKKHSYNRGTAQRFTSFQVS